MSLRRSTLLQIEPRLKDLMTRMHPQKAVVVVQKQPQPQKARNKETPIKTRQRLQKLPEQFNVSKVYKALDDNLPPLTLEEQFDAMSEDLLISPVNFAIEKALRRFFKTEIAVVWRHEKDKKILYSATYGRSVLCDCGLLGAALVTGYYLTAPVQSEHEKYCSQNDSSIIAARNSVLVLPIEGDHDNITYVAQISLGQDAFTQEHFEIASYLIEQFHIYGRILFNEATVMNLPQAYRISQRSAESVCLSLQNFFHCNYVYFVVYRPKLQQYVRITKDTGCEDKDILNPSKLGFSTDSIKKMKVINVMDVTEARDYDPSIDGSDHVAAMSIPFLDKHDAKWVCVLKGPKKRAYFTTLDENLLSILIYFACRALSFIFSPQSLDEEIDLFETRLKSLLEVAEILSGVLDIDTLLPTIMNHACKLLCAERCSLFLVDSAHNELTTRFHGGLSNAIHVKIGRGLVGSCAQTGEVINIKDAYADQRFDRSVDLSTGFTTRSLLCIPIYNNRGEITGVTEMINKQNDGLFDDDDIKMLMAFNVFCGISIDNARLYKASLDLTGQLRSFIEMSAALNTTTTSDSILQEILQNIQSIVNASRVTLFLCDEVDNTLQETKNIGESQKYGLMFAQETVTNRKFMLFDHKDVLGRTQTHQLNQAIDRILAAGLDADLLVFGEEEGMAPEEEEFYDEDLNQFGVPPIRPIESTDSPTYLPSDQSDSDSQDSTRKVTNRQSEMPSQQKANQRVHFGMDSLSSNSQSQSSQSQPSKKSASSDDDGSDEEQGADSSEVICCLPLLSSEAAILGVIEISCNWKILSEDVKLLDCFAVFSAVSIERSRLKDKASLGETFFEMKNWIAESELKQTSSIPKKLIISMDKLSTVLMLKFNAPDWDGIGLFKVVYAIFDIFDLNLTYGISNEKLFRFLSEVRDGYKKVPYHNWRHAVDVMQFVAYQILVGGCDAFLTKFEIFAILVSSLCHDVGHDGFTNAFNEKAETPLGLLFKNQSVMETHHCSVSIGIISKEECNIFANLSSSEFKNMWILIIQLILSTDMGKHFEIIKGVTTKLDQKTFDVEKNQEDRYHFLEILIKCGDVSNVSRPFELANKWCDVLCEEFFRQGDLEKTSGMEYTSPLNDRGHLDKPKSQIGFYNGVCLPLFQVAARIAPKLQCDVEQIQSNLGHWTAAIEHPNE